jgi:type VI secretion system protein VasD
MCINDPPQTHHLLPPHARPRARAVGTVLLCLAIAGCASSSGGGSGVIDKTLEFVGLKKPEPPALPDGELPKIQLDKKVTLRIHAGQVLNTDPSGRALSLVTRVYKLRAASQFSLAPYEAFKDAAAEKAAFGEELISARDVVLVPGQQYNVVETLPPEATHLAVVALFRAPDRQRWRFAFDAKAAAKSGVTLGAHGCALSVAVGEPVGAAPETLRLAGVQCR